MSNEALDKMLDRAIEYHRAGRRMEAEALYQRILSAEPERADVLYLIGLLNYDAGLYDKAAGFTEAVIRLSPAHVEAHKQLGNCYREMGRLEAAAACYRQALSVAPSDPELYYNLGVLYQAQGNTDSALACYQEALARREAFPEAYNNLGNVLKELNRPEQALICFRKAIDLRPDFAEAYNNMGTILQDRQEFVQARHCYERAIELNRRYAVAYNNLGNLFREVKDVDNAAAAYRDALQIDPRIADAYYSLGIIAYGRHDLEEAIAWTDKALGINPDHVDALNNMGVSLYDRLQGGDAIPFYRRAIGIHPGFAEAHWNLSLALLLSGSFAEGWREYEWRRGMREIFPPRDFRGSQWRGEPLSGKRLLLYAEQGFGDVLQFIRYARLLSGRGAEVLVECQRELVSLLSGQEGIAAVYGRGDDLPAYDCHCPILSLPGLFGTDLSNIPGEVPYLRAEDERLSYWRGRLEGDGPGLKVGLSWAGRPTHKKDRQRSLKLMQLAPLGSVAGVTYYSLQKGDAAEESQRPPGGLRLVDYTGELVDFADTAGLVGNLDLVISVDTAVVHLAGGMGKAVWTLLPYAPDWRWLLGREDSPWYPTMCLFRQGKAGDWSEVIGRAASELAAVKGR
jgi:tetratricopeptide (TPR) repeat protein